MINKEKYNHRGEKNIKMRNLLTIVDKTNFKDANKKQFESPKRQFELLSSCKGF